MNGILRERDGHLFVVYETHMDSAPTLRRMWWRVQATKGNSYNAQRPEAGDTVTSSGDHWNAYREGQGSKGSVYFPGSQKAEFIEE